MPSEEYIKKYARKRNHSRNSAEIQQPFKKPQKHILPVDMLIYTKPIIVFDRKLLDLRSEVVWKFIRDGR